MTPFAALTTQVLALDAVTCGLSFEAEVRR